MEGTLYGVFKHCESWKARWLVFELIGKDTKWYVCELAYYDNPHSDWILGPTVTGSRKAAMRFCKAKAEKIAKILSDETDEEGYRNDYFIERS